MVHSASKYDLEAQEIKDRLANGKKLLQDLNGEEVGFRTPEGQLLNGMFFPGRQLDKVIIFRGGSGQFYEDSYQEISFLLKSGVSVFTYNPEGVAKSKGTSSPYYLALDYFSAFSLMTGWKGILPEHILAYGWSLGSLETTTETALVQEERLEKNLCTISDRSLASTRKYMEAELEPFDEALNHLSWTEAAGNLYDDFLNCDFFSALTDLSDALLKPISWAIGCSRLVSFAVPLVDWDMDALEALRHIKGQKCFISHPQDNVIPLTAQIATVLAGQPEDTMTFIELDPTIASGEEPHSRPFSKTEEKDILKVIRQFLKVDEAANDLDPDRFQPLNLSD